MVQEFKMRPMVIVIACGMFVSNMVLADQATMHDRCFDINKIEFKGAYQMSSAKKSRLKKEYENRCLRSDDIQQLVRNITNEYISNGHMEI